MSTPTTVHTYPYITAHPEISGGEPIVEGARITVRCIAGYSQTRLQKAFREPEALLEQYPRLPQETGVLFRAEAGKRIDGETVWVIRTPSSIASRH